VRSLALALAPEYQWIGYAAESADSNYPNVEPVEKSYNYLVRRFVELFFEHLVNDERNVQAIKKTAKRRRRALVARETAK
jgi:hypothetical protein